MIDPRIASLNASLDRPVVLVGLMGSGKTTLGRALARKMMRDFIDADDVIVAAEGKTIPEIFADHGEDHFRNAEREAIAGLFNGKVKIISTGGGAFINDETRALIGEKGISLWLKADVMTLAARTAGDRNRPLLKGGDPVETLGGLIDKRYPVYAQADITVETGAERAEQTLDKIIDALCRHAGL
jgi:shikimate kinase